MYVGFRVKFPFFCTICNQNFSVSTYFNYSPQYQFYADPCGEVELFMGTDRLTREDADSRSSQLHDGCI